MTKKVFWAVLLERTISDLAAQGLMDVAARAGKLEYSRLRVPYGRPDIVRNVLAKAFMLQSTEPDDTLVMLDNDHIHPVDVIERLVAHDKMVAGALAFRRGTPFFPCAFMRDDNGGLRVMESYPKGLIEVSVLGMAAIAIQRRTFQALDAAGYEWPWFRYIYKPGEEVLPSEDIYFGESCEAADIPHYLDTTLICPHIAATLVDESTWAGWLEENRERLKAPDFSQQELFAPKAAA